MFTKKEILIIHSQQPSNQYAGKSGGVNDSEQFWMRKLAEEVVSLLKDTGHEVKLGPTGNASSNYNTNVRWVQQPENRDADLLISLHSNATGKSEASAKGTVGVGVYYHAKSARGKSFAQKFLPFLKPVSAGPKAYLGTLTVAELSNTTPPSLLIENEYHDWSGSATAGGAEWIRNAANRTKLAGAYRDFIVSMWGSKAAPKPPVVEPPVVVEPVEPPVVVEPPVPVEPPPVPPKPVADSDVDFRAGGYNAQLPRFGGGPAQSDVSFIRDVLKPSILAGQEMDENTRTRIGKALGFKYWTINTIAMFWDPEKYENGNIVQYDLNHYHGLVGCVLTSKANGESFFSGSVHGIPSDALPSSWSDAKKVRGKLAGIKKMLTVVEKYSNVMLTGDWATKEAKAYLEKKGYRMVTPYTDTMDKPGSQRVDGTFIKGARLVARTKGSTHGTSATDHRATLANLTIKGK